MMKNTKDISFVVQGPVLTASKPLEGVFSTSEVLESIRLHFPDAEIILSTWKDADTTGLTFDELVLSEDPGGFTLGGLTMNYNRLILSTKSGIAKASRPFVVKTRTDILMTGNNLLDQLEHITEIPENKYRLFKKTVLSTVYYVRNPIKLNLVFHPSDIFLVGTKEDLLSYFSVPLPSREFYFNPDNSTKIVSEQYFLVHKIAKEKNIDYRIPRWGYINLRYFLDSEKYIFNNFRFLSTIALDVEFPKRLYAVYRPKSNYSLTQAEMLTEVYTKDSAYSKMVIFGRGTLYFAYHYLLYYPKVFYHDVLRRYANQLKNATLR